MKVPVEKVTFSISRTLLERANQHYPEQGYTSFSSYIVALMVADIKGTSGQVIGLSLLDKEQAASEESSEGSREAATLKVIADSTPNTSKIRKRTTKKHKVGDRSAREA